METDTQAVALSWSYQRHSCKQGFMQSCTQDCANRTHANRDSCSHALKTVSTAHVLTGTHAIVLLPVETNAPTLQSQSYSCTIRRNYKFISSCKQSYKNWILNTHLQTRASSACSTIPVFIYEWKLNNITQTTLLNFKDENLWNSHWCLIRTHHNYPFKK